MSTRPLSPQSQVHAMATFVAIVSFSMLFATLFLVYGAFRLSAPAWPPPEFERLNFFLPTLATLILILSSLTFALYQRAYFESRPQIHLYGPLTILLGISFVGIQFQFWQALKAAKVFAGTHALTSVLYGFTWIHTFHVAGGLLALLSLWPTLKKKPFPFLHSRVTNVGKFWHFLGGVWLLIYLGIFVF